MTRKTLVFILFLILFSCPSWAAYDGSKPADDGYLSDAPAEIRANFAGIIGMILNSISSSTTVIGSGTHFGYSSAGGASGTTPFFSWVGVCPVGSDSVVYYRFGPVESIPPADGTDAGGWVVGIATGSVGSKLYLWYPSVDGTDPAAGPISVSELGIGLNGLRITSLGSATTDQGAVNLGQAKSIHGRAVFATDSAWVCPEGVTTAWISGCGGGGGGGGAGRTNSTTYFHGAGGKAGAFAIGEAVAVTPGKTYDIEIGTGGAGGATGDSDPDPGVAGSNGSDTVLSSSSAPLLTCAGGAGGAAGSDTVSQGETVEILGQSSPFGPCLRGSDYGSEAGYGNGGFGGHRSVSPGGTVVFEGQAGRNGLLIIEY